MPSQTFVATPLATAGGRVISSPFQFYVTGEDRLRVISVNSVSGVVVTVRWRFIDAAGKASANEQRHTPNSNRTTASNDYELGLGALLNLTAFASSGSPLSGQTYILVQLVRGIGGAAIVLGTLLGGYVTAVQHLAWPGSPIVRSTEGEPAIRAVTGTTPAAGAEIVETVPTGARWSLLSARFTFTASATVANRKPNWTHKASGNTIYKTANTNVIAAGQLGDYSVAPNVGYAVDTTNLLFTLPSPRESVLLAAHTFGTTTINVQVGDQYSAPNYLVREWLEVN